VRGILWLTALALAPAAAPAQQPLPVGTEAPDFVLAAATRSGVMATPLRLSDYRDQTVVIAFFYRARSSG
jgi:peroxiredoxin